MILFVQEAVTRGRKAMIKKKTPPIKAAAKKKAAKSPDPIETAIAKFEGRLCKEDIKLADYLRLLQIRKEREENRPRLITVRWIENWEAEKAKDL